MDLDDILSYITLNKRSYFQFKYCENYRVQLNERYDL